jgi:uncharacterized phage-associated protein
MYKVLDVCRHIINYCDDKEYNVSNLKLQKILYFIQAYFLTQTEDKMPCFEEKIEAWDFGPVVPTAYHEYKQYGSADIPRISFFYDFAIDEKFHIKRVEYVDDEISAEDKQLIDKMIDKLADYSTTTLVSITHNQAPWRDAYSQGKNTVITTDAIRRYYNG